MFCLLVPAAVAPIVGTLVWGEKKAERLGLVKRMDQEQNKEPLLQKLKRFVVDLDLIGLILLTVGWGLLLVALTLSGGAAGRWNNPSIIAMVVVGPLILIGFGMWEIKWAKYPAIPGMFLRNRALMCSSFIAFFDFVRSHLVLIRGQNPRLVSVCSKLLCFYSGGRADHLRNLGGTCDAMDEAI